MNNHLFHLLSQWNATRDEQRWVLGTVYRTRGSAYRKPGAFMLFNDLGQQFGMLSGGCLESDLQKKAMQCLATGNAKTLRYDSQDEDDLTYQLGLGCGGVVEILLQPVTAENNYLDLDKVFARLYSRHAVVYWQKLPGSSDGNAIGLLGSDESRNRAEIVEKDGCEWLVTPVQSIPHLLIVGGGVDARPLAAMASQLGWEVSLADPRPTNARREHFNSVNRISRLRPGQLNSEEWFSSINAAVIMSHNTELDAEALVALKSKSLDYLGLLGPAHRREQVLELADLSNESLNCTLAGPAGLDIGAEYPESIALSILAECHAAINQCDGSSLSEILHP